jgi:Fe-S-cluster containining protein
MKGTDQPHPRCIALRGVVGADVWCAIYERRPSVCRELMPSGRDGQPSFWCDHAREIWGLPRLVPTPEPWSRPLTFDAVTPVSH